jgi:hypothetical protein
MLTFFKKNKNMKTKDIYCLEVRRLEMLLKRLYFKQSEYGVKDDSVGALKAKIRLLKNIGLNSLLFLLVSCAPCKLATTPVKVIDYDKQTNIYIGQGKNCYCAFYSDQALNINDTIQAQAVEIGDITQNIPQRIWIKK